MNRLVEVAAPKARQQLAIQVLGRLLAALARSRERARTRRILGQLNDQQLADLGISYADRLAELDKPFWR